MKITVIGAGYVGLVTAACLADVGHQVLCAKKSKKKFEMLKREYHPYMNRDLVKCSRGILKKTGSISPPT